MEYSEKILQKIKTRDPDQHEFHQAVEEVFESIKPALERNPQWREAGILERIVTPDRIIIFRVVWVDDKGNEQRNWSIQRRAALSPKRQLEHFEVPRL